MSDVFKPDKKVATTDRQCPQCGLTLPLSTPVGMCPKCLLLGLPNFDADSEHDPAATNPTPGPRPATGAADRPPVWQPPVAQELQEMLPQYEVMELLGRGGMGAVYKGRQIALDRLVAIKLLQPDIGEEVHNFAGRFNLEARAMAKMKHPGIVAVYDFGQTSEGLLYFVMELVEGMDVQRMIAQEGRLHSANAVSIAAHVCEALQYAHERGIIHRDIKPANVIVDYDGHVKVADFGLVKVMNAGPTSTFTISGNVMGTPHYIAPEALVLGASVDQRADIYAVGVMLYHMLTGRLPQGMFELPSLKVPGLDPRLDGIIARAMRENCDQRYQSAAELRFDLVNILTQPVPQTIPLPPQEDTELRSLRLASALAARPQRSRMENLEHSAAEEDELYLPAAHEILQTSSSLNNTMLVLGAIALLTIGGLALFLANRKTGDVHNFQQTITTSTTNNTYFTQLIAAGVTSKDDLAALEEIRPLGEGFVGISRTSQTWTQAVELAKRTGAEILTVDTTQTAKVETLNDWLSSKQPAPDKLWVRKDNQPALLIGENLQTPDSQENTHATLLMWKPEKISASSEPTYTPATPATDAAPKTPPAAPPVMQAAPKIHAWTDVTGRTIQAEFLRLEGEIVIVRMNDAEFKVPLERLSPPSIELARQLAAQPK
jgi:serine/threonine protein kinase